GGGAEGAEAEVDPGGRGEDQLAGGGQAARDARPADVAGTAGQREAGAAVVDAGRAQPDRADPGERGRAGALELDREAARAEERALLDGHVGERLAGEVDARVRAVDEAGVADRDGAAHRGVGGEEPDGADLDRVVGYERAGAHEQVPLDGGGPGEGYRAE